MRKSTAIMVWITAFLLAITYFGVNIYFNHFDPGEDVVYETGEPETKVYTKTLTVSAVGDCTLATDIYMASSISFDSVYKSIDKDPGYFFENVRDYFVEDDLTIVNFEGALSDDGIREIKQYAFRGKPEYAKILTESSIEAANLANNHSYDYGEKAFNDTKEILSDSDVAHFGMKEYAVKVINGIKIGLVGTNALNYEGRASFPKVIEKLKKKENPDLIIASFHWGEELDKIPNYIQKNLAHQAIDNGADLVLGHHPHVLQGIEKYKGKYIVYSLGNFCFGGNHNPTDKDSMIFRQCFTFENGDLIEDDEVSVIPCSISSQKSKNDYKPTPLTGDEFERVKDKISARSENFEGIEYINFIEE